MKTDLLSKTDFFFIKEWKYNDIHPQSQIWKPIYCQKLIFFL